MEVRYFIGQLVQIFADMLIIAIFIRVILSWFKRAGTPQGKFSLFIMEITEPILGVVRRFMPKTGMLDLSPIVAFLMIELLRYLILSII